MENFNDEFNDIFDNVAEKDLTDYSDEVIRKKSEDSYVRMSEIIVNESINEFKKATDFSRECKTVIRRFVILFVAGFSVATCFVLRYASQISTNVVIAYLTTFMVNVIACVISLQRLVFDDKYQTGIINTLHKYLGNYQKFNNAKILCKEND